MSDERRVPDRGRNRAFLAEASTQHGASKASSTFVTNSGGYPMQTFHLQRQRLILVAAVCLIFPCLVMAADESTPNKEQIKHFLLTAKVVGGKQTAKGVTQPWRLTLSDGTLTHDVSLPPIGEHKDNVT